MSGVITRLRGVDSATSWPLHDVAATRGIERWAMAQQPEPRLMQRAGLAAAQLALALAPHARRICVAAGPGNNGGDGMEAAIHLHTWGKEVVVTWLGSPSSASPDALSARQRALAAGVVFAEEPPEQADLCIDALLGIGASRAPSKRMAQWISHMHNTAVPVLAIDVPTGLHADTGVASPVCVRAIATLCLLTLKPGLFTGSGRDAAGQVWIDSLIDLDGSTQPAGLHPCATLAGAAIPTLRKHASHKGSYGDVAIIGGAPGMVGAALLAGSAALHCGAGRVFVALLDPAAMAVDIAQPELMLRSAGALNLTAATVVCGCGGGDAVRAHLHTVLSAAPRLVVDADALNALAGDTQLRNQVRARARRGWQTVLTPHPLEAARLLGCTSAEVQNDRLAAAGRLVRDFQCVVVLKGSGSVIAGPAGLPTINPTGNARLATAGTGDVLAGAIGAGLALGLPALQAAGDAVYRHGQIADRWPAHRALTASRLAQAFQLPDQAVGV